MDKERNSELNTLLHHEKLQKENMDVDKQLQSSRHSRFGGAFTITLNVIHNTIKFTF